MEEEREYDTENGFSIRIVAKLKNAKLIGAREMLGLSAEKLAEQLGIGYNSYLDYEAMKRYPPAERQKVICDFFRENGVFLLEEDVFPEELRQAHPRRKYTIERTIPKERLLSLTDISRKMLPVIESEAERIVELDELKDDVNVVLSSLTHREEQVVRMSCGLGTDGKKYNY